MNEFNELIPLFLVLIIGAVIGFLIYHVAMGRSKASKQQQEEELKKYKVQVNEHFDKSAELMGQVANSYQALYNHMADQSQSLLGETASTQFPLLKASDNTDEEIQVSETEMKLEEVETTVTEDKPEEIEATETEIKSEEVEAIVIESATAKTEIKSEEVETIVMDAETDVKSEEKIKNK